MRINQWLARATGLSRRAADAAITGGRVVVNGHPATIGQEVGDTDQVTLDNQPVKLAKLTYIALYKPVGYICSRRPQGNAKTIYDLLAPDLHQLKSIGRLDKDSSGLLVLTNDGPLAQKLSHPSQEKLKEYELTLDRDLALADREQVESGVMLPDGLSQFELFGRGKKWTARLHEGRNRQIRRTLETLGYQVTRLHRTSFGKLKLGTVMKPGDYRRITAEEIL